MEAEQFRARKLWHRWDYPNQVSSRQFDERYPIIGQYLADNWRAFRTWGLSGISPWEHEHYWKLRDGVDKRRVTFNVDWEDLQKPGFSPDYSEERYERMDLASSGPMDRHAGAGCAQQSPVGAYWRETARFTSKTRLFFRRDNREAIHVINNSRRLSALSAMVARYRKLTGTKRGFVPTGHRADNIPRLRRSISR